MTPLSPHTGLPSLPADLLQQIVDTALGPIVYIDAERRCRFVTRTHEEWLGHARAEVEGRLLEEVFGEVG
jgi:PAS domain-containing protein